jgi:hypothetical protein
MTRRFRLLIDTPEFRKGAEFVIGGDLPNSTQISPKPGGARFTSIQHTYSVITIYLGLGTFFEEIIDTQALRSQAQDLEKEAYAKLNEAEKLYERALDVEEKRRP